jgi:hypothetical protein
MKKETICVCLDTSFIEGQNFLEGHKLRELGNLSRVGEIKLVIAKIVLNEVKSRFKKNIKQINDSISAFKSKLNKEGKAIKNLDLSENYLKIPVIDARKAIDEFKEKLDGFISYNNIEVIDAPGINVNDILEDYFEEKPPFHNEKKKHEFPDAIIIKTYESYFQGIGIAGNFFSKDKDLLAYRSKSLNIVEDESQFIFSLIKAYQSRLEKQETLNQIEKLFKSQKEVLEKQAAATIESELTNRYWPLNNDFDFEEFTNLEILKSELGDYSIVFLNFTGARLESSLTLHFRATVKFNDFSMATYDKETEEWMGLQTRDKDILFNESIPVELTVDNNPVAGQFYSKIRLNTIDTLRYIQLSKYLV